MICPSCSHQNPDNARFCGRCHMAYNALSQLFLRFVDHGSWILRRASAGFLSGLVAWFFIPALGRIISSESSPVLFFFVNGLLGGAFLGTVDGMVDESTSKTLNGALFGGIGGAMGGALFGWFNAQLPAEKIYYGVFVFWAIAGAFVGLVSSIWEKKANKIFVGVASGFIGGGIGAILGISVYTFLIQQYEPHQWFLRRLIEGLNGGIIGVTLWFFIGAAERFVIFRRRPLNDKAFKECDACHMQNPLASWYCSQCGGVLQWAAPSVRLNLSPYMMLDRLQQWLRFLSRLSATTGVIAGLIVFAVCVPIEPLFACLVTVLVAALSYSLLVVFSSLSETIQIYIRK